MPEMFSYIFSNLEASERAIREQGRFNRNMLILSIASVILISIQVKRIEKLEKEVEELKQTKGE